MVFKFPPINCEMVINSILVIIIIVLSINILYKKFNNENLSNIDNSLKDRVKKAKIVIYKTDSCSYCQKLMKELEHNGLHTYVRQVDVSTPDGKKEYIALNEEGVPIVKCENNGKICIGYHPIPKLIKKLNI